jgi:hypothetical protein
MHPHSCTVDVFNLEGNPLVKPEPQGINGKQTGAIPEFVHKRHDSNHLFDSEHIREPFDFGRTNNIRPVPLFFKNSFPEEAQSPSINLNGA